MKVLEDTPERLRLRVIPFGAAALLGGVTLILFLWGAALFNAGQPTGGAALIGIGVIFFIGCFSFFVKVLSVTLDRGSNLAEVTESGIFGRKVTSHRLGEIHGATLQSTVIKRRVGDLSAKGRKSYDRSPEPRVWRVAFARKGGAPLPLSDVYGRETTALAVGGAINAWFGRPN